MFADVGMISCVKSYVNTSNDFAKTHKVKEIPGAGE